MRISDWSSDVCSSDLGAHPPLARVAALRKELTLLSPREAIERVIGACDLVPRILQWCSNEAEARQRVANVDAILALAATYEDSCRATGKPGSVSGLMRWFDEQAEAEKDRSEEHTSELQSLMR